MNVLRCVISFICLCFPLYTAYWDHQLHKTAIASLSMKEAGGHLLAVIEITFQWDWGGSASRVSVICVWMKSKF